MGLRLFVLPNFPVAMFIPGATFIPDSIVCHTKHQCWSPLFIKIYSIYTDFNTKNLITSVNKLFLVYKCYKNLSKSDVEIFWNKFIFTGTLCFTSFLTKVHPSSTIYSFEPCSIAISVDTVGLKVFEVAFISFQTRPRLAHERILGNFAAQPGPNGQLSCFHSFKTF